MFNLTDTMLDSLESAGDAYFEEKRKKMKPKDGGRSKPGGYDSCGTPSYALKPLLDHLYRKTVWESASNDDHLIADRLREWGKCVVVESGFFSRDNAPRSIDFLTEDQRVPYDVQVTNPPFSLKYKWLERSYELGKPFALLLPVETIGAGKALRLFNKFGVQVIFLTRRVNFKMPVKGWNCQAQFPTAWFTWHLDRLDYSREFSVAEINNTYAPLYPLDKIVV